MTPWIPGADPSIAGNASTSASWPRCQAAGALAPTMPFDVAELRRDRLRVAAVLDEHVDRLHHAGADPGRGELSAAGDRRARAREVLQLRLVRVHLRAQPDEHADHRQTGDRHRPRAPDDETCPATPGAVLGMAFVDEPLRQHADAVDARPQRLQHRREQRDRSQHGDERDQHAADPDRADERQRQDDHRQQADRHRGAGDDHRPAGMRHRLGQRRLDVRCPRGARRGSGRSSAASSRSRHRARPARSGTGR